VIAALVASLNRFPMRPRFALALLPFTLAAADGTPATYHKQQLSDQFFSEGACFGDFNHDGKMDVASGPYWYAGPDFKQRHEFYPASSYDPLKYSDNFFAFAHDFNGDGWSDILVLGFPGVDASWFENPGEKGGTWRRHVVFLPVDNESPTFGDVLKNGQPVLLCMSAGRLGYASFDAKDAGRPWTWHAISPVVPGWQRFTHGLGFGDLNGDGRNDILEKDGWWEQPASLAGDPVWKKHPFTFASGHGSSQMYVYDVNGDGKADVITCRDPHGYGLTWYEQTRGADGAIGFKEHAILSTKPDEKMNGVQFSQLHAVALADMDGDGLLDIVTGKRWWAHGPKGDPDPMGTPVLYAFLLRRGAGGEVRYEAKPIDDASGIGTQLVVEDVNRDGRPDIVVGNKRGTFVFISK
jgi:hypothetical protein